MKYLAKMHHCDSQVETALGCTPLHFAAWKGHLAAVQFLIEDLKCDCKSSEDCHPTSMHLLKLVINNLPYYLSNITREVEMYSSEYNA